MLHAATAAAGNLKTSMLDQASSPHNHTQTGMTMNLSGRPKLISSSSRRALKYSFRHDPSQHTKCAECGGSPCRESPFLSPSIMMWPHPALAHWQPPPLRQGRRALEGGGGGKLRTGIVARGYEHGAGPSSRPLASGCQSQWHTQWHTVRLAPICQWHNPGTLPCWYHPDFVFRSSVVSFRIRLNLKLAIRVRSARPSA
jgi:hypothetical protein